MAWYWIVLLTVLYVLGILIFAFMVASSKRDGQPIKFIYYMAVCFWPITLIIESFVLLTRPWRN